MGVVSFYDHRVKATSRHFNTLPVAYSKKKGEHSLAKLWE